MLATNTTERTYALARLLEQMQEHADRAREVMLVITRQDPRSRAEGSWPLPYAVAEHDATAWEAAEAYARLVPRG